MRFVETGVFTRELPRWLSDDEYSGLQAALLLRPGQGRLIPGTGGLRKLRWRTQTGGKRGGLRIVYYWDRDAETIYLLFIYPKSRRADLTVDQIRVLRRLVREELQ